MVSLRNFLWGLDYRDGVRGAYRALQPESKLSPFASMSELLAQVLWPTHYAFMGDYPKDHEARWTNLAQGVTHSLGSQNGGDVPRWYFSGYFKVPSKKEGTTVKSIPRFRVVGFPLEFDLRRSTRDAKATGQYVEGVLPLFFTQMGYNHLGAICYHDGLVICPLEGGGNLGAVAALDDKTLNFVAWGSLPSQGKKAPWLAVNPRNGILYSSVFEEADSIEQYSYEVIGNKLIFTSQGRILLYQRTPIPQIGYRDGIARQPDAELPFEPHESPVRAGDYFKLTPEQLAQPPRLERVWINSVQGGAFSKNGHLYLVSDSGTKHGGIFCIDAASGIVAGRITVDVEHRFIDEEFIGDELQGLTILATEDLPFAVPGITGQIHLVMTDVDYFIDDLYFKHYAVPWDDRGRV